MDQKETGIAIPVSTTKQQPLPKYQSTHHFYYCHRYSQHLHIESYVRLFSTCFWKAQKFYQVGDGGIAHGRPVRWMSCLTTGYAGSCSPTYGCFKETFKAQPVCLGMVSLLETLAHQERLHPGWSQLRQPEPAKPKPQAPTSRLRFPLGWATPMHTWCSNFPSNFR